MTYKQLTDNEIDFYVETINPVDKAGSYGIQDWIGMIGVEKITGSYTSVAPSGTIQFSPEMRASPTVTGTFTTI